MCYNKIVFQEMVPAGQEEKVITEKYSILLLLFQHQTHNIIKTSSIRKLQDPVVNQGGVRIVLTALGVFNTPCMD